MYMYICENGIVEVVNCELICQRILKLDKKLMAGRLTIRRRTINSSNLQTLEF